MNFLDSITIRQEIDSDLDSLDEWHYAFPWIPGRDQIRPNFQTLARKYDFMDTLSLYWISLDDFLWHHVFGKEYSFFQGKKFINSSNEIEKQTETEKEPVLQEAMFPYQLSQGGYHYVLWYPSFESIEKNKIQKDLEKLILKCSKRNPEKKELQKEKEIQFAWYINPKPSVLSFFHVQVFTNSILSL